MTKKRPSHPKSTHVAAFGAALSTLVVAPQAQAGAVGLNFSPNSVPAGGGTSTGSSVQFRSTGGSATVFAVWQWNDLIGKTVATVGSSDSSYGSLIRASFSNSLTTGLFGTSALFFGPGASGLATFGFLTPGGNLGWFQINLGGTGNPVTYLAGAYNTTPGASIHVGTLPPGPLTVPEPATEGLAGLALLALGATEIRRRRKAQAKQATQ